MVSAGDGRRTAMVLRDASGLRAETTRSDVELLHAAYVAEFVEFVSAVREGRPPSVTGTDARRALAVALACVRSVEAGGPVPVAQA